jgi:dihydrofolate synthase/folylpolyglutamate synthase
MTYAEAVDHLYALAPELAPNPGAPPRKFDLAHMRALAAELGDPQLQFPSILIAGTNGKGSTAATLASILTSAGYRTGLYTSPHLSRPNERIQMARPTLPSEYGSVAIHGADGALTLTPIADDDFAALYTDVDRACERLLAADRLPVLPSFFERLTALAFLYFSGAAASLGGAAKADIVILEVGLGGRLDATNIVEPLLSIVTDISLDHQEYLGNSINEIAREKCGILRAGVPLITLSQHPQANQAIGEAAAALGTPGINAADYLPPAQRNQAAGATTFPTSLNTLATETASLLTQQRNHYTLPLASGLLEVDSPLAGAHQQRNIALALAAAFTLSNQYGYEFTNASIEAGIRNTVWPGRLEFVAPNLLLDVAHNPAGAWTLRAALAALPDATPRTLIFSCLRDKSLTEMSRILFPLFDSSVTGDPARRRDHIILAPIASPRAADVQYLLTAAHALGIPAHAAPHLAGALHQAQLITPPGGLIVATGSVYLVGEVRQLALHPEPVHA